MAYDSYLISSFSAGVRLVDELLAKSGINNCSNFKETADVIAKVAFRMFLGITPEISNWSADGNSFSLILTDNPLVDFVEVTVYHNCRVVFFAQLVAPQCGICNR